MVRRANHALDQGDFDRAWTTWSGIVRYFPNQRDLVNRGLAETVFRRSLQQADRKEAIAGLLQAVQFSPRDATYRYHLALHLHRNGQLKEALEAYKLAHELGFAAQRLGYPWALAALEANSREHQALARSLVTDPAQQAALEAVATLRRKKPAAPASLDKASDRLSQMWIGLAHLARGEHQAARLALEAAGGPKRQPESPDALEAVRRYYLGVLAATTNDQAAAEAHWLAAFAAGLPHLPGVTGGDGLTRNLGYLHRQRAAALLGNEHYEKALAEAQTGLHLAPDDRILAEIASLAGFHLGNQAGTAGDWQKALGYWQTAYDASPSRYLSLNLGLAHEQLQKWMTAGEYWRDMARRRPRKEDHPDYLTDEQVAAVWARAALCYAQAGDPAESAAAFRTALKYAPDNIELHLEMAKAQLASGSDQAALNTLERARKVDPQHVGALQLIAGVYAACGDGWMAARYWQRVLAIEPDHLEARRELCNYYQSEGDSYLDFGRHELAVATYQQGLEIDPQHGGLLGSLAVAWARRRDRTAAADYARQAAEYSGATPSGYLHAARAMLILGTSEDALAYARLAGERVPNLAPGFYMDLAVSALDYKQDALFAEFERMAENIADDKIEFYHTTAGTLISLGRLALAETYLKRLLEADPHNRQGCFMLGVVYAETGRVKEAKKLWREGKQLARKAGDLELLEVIEATEALFGSGMPPGFFGMMMNLLEQEM